MKCILKRKKKTDTSVVFVHGFTDSIHNKTHKDKWKKSLNRVFKTADLFYFNWDADSKIDILFRILQKGLATLPLCPGSLFTQSARILFDSLLELKYAYETAVKEAESAGRSLRQGIGNIKNDYTYIAVVGHSLGAKVVQKALAGIRPNIVNAVYLCGAATPETGWDKSMKAVEGRIFNLYSKQDRILTLAHLLSIPKNPVGWKGFSACNGKIIDIAVACRHANYHQELHVRPLTIIPSFVGQNKP
jgi:hypothetical protein